MLKMMFSGEKFEDIECRPCPFCGGTNFTITNKKNYDDLVEKNGSSCIGIECNGCDTEMRLFDIPNNQYIMGMKMLVTKWNTRKEDLDDGVKED